MSAAFTEYTTWLRGPKISPDEVNNHDSVLDDVHIFIDDIVPLTYYRDILL
jgi:hypothetical protein